MSELKTDIEIAQASRMLPIEEIAGKIGIGPEQLENYGRYKAKVDIHALKDLPRKAKLILVTAISPTPAGEGKTTTSVGLADALNRLGKKTVVCLREPSLGPVFGVKGGAAGGGYAQVVPMEDINLHFTGDFHAIGITNNLLSAMLLFSGALLTQGLMDWFFNYVLWMKEDPLYMLGRMLLPDMAYTLVVSPLLYGLTLLIAKTLRKRD